MGRIHQLSPQVIAQIAAGEVIERPASVVKELVENAIDAGATRIDIDLDQGGIELIRVADNGCGMDSTDLPLALTAHATSKLRDASDLFHISTLGFRGEGLASIGGISKLVLQSRPQTSPTGSEIRCDGGALSTVRPWNGAAGTRIEVRHLFYNIPVRRRFLRGPSTELGHISEVFTRIALSHLSLHLTLRHNNRVLHDIPSGAGLLDRIGWFFGEEMRKRLFPVEAEKDGLTLGGYLADPVCDQAGTQMQYLFINGRWVRDRIVSGALQEAYRGLLMTSKHPACVLFLELPPEEVDVNVHPTKAEVRFRRPDRVSKVIQEAVRERLGGEDLTAPLRTRPAKVVEGLPPTRSLQADLPLSEPHPVQPFVAPPRIATRTDAPREAPSRQHEELLPPVPPPAPVPTPVVNHPRAFQLHNMYLVVEVPEGMLLIDQHALHERILFERLKKRLTAGPMEVQKLLVPEPVTLPPTLAARILEHRILLMELGLEVSDFTGNSLLLAGYPAILGKRSPRQILQGVADYLASMDQPPRREVLLNDLLSLVACHSAVRAGDRLGQQEIDALVTERHLAQDAHHCPHGRPSSLLFTRQDLDRQFRRA